MNYRPAVASCLLIMKIKCSLTQFALHFIENERFRNIWNRKCSFGKRTLVLQDNIEVFMTVLFGISGSHVTSVRTIVTYL
jgi:hypothetical protein